MPVYAWHLTMYLCKLSICPLMYMMPMYRSMYVTIMYLL
jgi:hypothetical protein